MDEGLAALRLAVDALGGPKAVGSRLWPDYAPERACVKLNHCLEVGRAEKLHLSQILLILAWAKAANYHAGMEQLGHLCGYTVRPKLADEDFAELKRRFAETQARNAELVRQLGEKLETSRKLRSVK